MEVYYKIRPKMKDIAKLCPREGQRINVGRFCLLMSEDQRSYTEAQVIQFNADNTVKLRAVHTGEQLENGEDIPISRIKRIERYGVSVYNYGKLPPQINKSSYAWTCTI